MKGSSTPTLYKPPSNRQNSEVRRANNDDSRSRSRDDRSKISYASVRSNKTSGPVIFGGNTTIKSSQKPTNDNIELLSKSEYSKSHSKSKTQTVKNRNKDEDYNAWVW